MAMVPALQFTSWQWASLTLAAPVVVWGAAALGRVVQPPPRGRDNGHARVGRDERRAAGRSTHSSSGRRAPGLTHPFSLTLAHGLDSSNIYLEVAAGVTTFVLAGRYAEARARRRSGAALASLLEMAAGGLGPARRPGGTHPGRPARGR